ncbi:MAG: alpha/beta hydrolase [Desulfobacterales bacterium]|jgi:fermentation-respiration switch protein FrsA (DUF1100 family)
MTDNADISLLDRPEVLRVLFHPRPEPADASPPPGAVDLMIDVGEGVGIGARCHMADQSSPTLLFFHGNGEIVSDYDELGPVYNRLGINFIPVDYRGYGRSGGSPTVASLMADCHRVLDSVRQWLESGGATGPLIVMGRSLGSAPALELAGRPDTPLAGLIIESGFAHAGPLLSLLGVRMNGFDLMEEHGFNQLEKIRAFEGPTLIIHAEYDHIIPFTDGEALFKAASSPAKKLLKIPGANHNDIFYRGLEPYLEAVQELVNRCRRR